MLKVNNINRIPCDDIASALNIDSDEYDKNYYLRIAVTKILLKLGIPVHLIGYHYLREAIILKVNNQNNYISMTKTLYPNIAKMFKTTASKVERSIRHAIETAWRKGNSESLGKIFSSIPQSGGKPSNSEFIATIAVNLVIIISDP